VAQRIVMPTSGMFTVEGSLGRWLRGAGEWVEAGEPVVEIQTEKVTFEVEAPASGRLHPVAAEGASLAIEGLLGWILAEGEAVPEAAEPARPAAGPAPDTGRAAAVAPAPGDGGSRRVASPAARRLAAEKGVDLSAVVGTGPGGRIVEADVLAAVTGEENA
jgi:pyruvate dehydrogenase E2 component (dihydrolipoamide acetyltransferase)